MIDIEEFQVRGVPGQIHKVKFGNRTVDYWAPEKPGSHLIVAHDGQNVLDKRNIGINPHQRATWELAQSAIRIAEKNNLTPPTVICVYHTLYAEDPIGRLKEYTPEKFMSSKDKWMIESHGLYSGSVDEFLSNLSANDLLEEITTQIVPQITSRISQNIEPAHTALLGASMGGLASIYGTITKPDFFHTSLAFSPHWVIGGDSLAQALMSNFPKPGKHKLWMSRGTKGLDAKYEGAQVVADRTIRSHGYRDGKDLQTHIFKRGAHTNATWARYVPQALDFWMSEDNR